MWMPRMLPGAAILALAAGAAVPAGVLGHPGAGIAVHEGKVYFTETGSGLRGIDPEGALLPVAGPAYHFLAIDPDNRFAQARMPRIRDADVRVVGENPAIILSSDFPLAVGPDGALYFPEALGERVRIVRLPASGRRGIHATLPLASETNAAGRTIAARWIHGLAAGAEGTLYYTEMRAVRKIGRDGRVSAVAEQLTVPQCIPPPAARGEGIGPGLRGLDVAEDGTIYVAASGCSVLLRIAPGGQVTSVLTTGDGWTPTAVAAARAELYVLEYRHVNSGRGEDWPARVRRMSPGGSSRIVATFARR